MRPDTDAWEHGRLPPGIHRRKTTNNAVKIFLWFIHFIERFTPCTWYVFNLTWIRMSSQTCDVRCHARITNSPHASAPWRGPVGGRRVRPLLRSRCLSSSPASPQLRGGSDRTRPMSVPGYLWRRRVRSWHPCIQQYPTGRCMWQLSSPAGGPGESSATEYSSTCLTTRQWKDDWTCSIGACGCPEAKSPDLEDGAKWAKFGSLGWPQYIYKWNTPIHTKAASDCSCHRPDSVHVWVATSLFEIFTLPMGWRAAPKPKSNDTDADWRWRFLWCQLRLRRPECSHIGFFGTFTQLPLGNTEPYPRTQSRSSLHPRPHPVWCPRHRDLGSPKFKVVTRDGDTLFVGPICRQRLKNKHSKRLKICMKMRKLRQNSQNARTRKHSQSHTGCNADSSFNLSCGYVSLFSVSVYQLTRMTVASSDIIPGPRPRTEWPGKCNSHPDYILVELLVSWQ